jgi:hypothetical protein
MPQLPIRDEAPTDLEITEYDRLSAPKYLRLLDADAAGASWEQAIKAVFGIDAAHEPERAKRVHETHLARARWMMETGYRDLLRMPGH